MEGATGASSSSAPAPGSSGAPEHGGASDALGQALVSLANVIASLAIADDPRGKEILAAAVALQDSSGPSRKPTMRKLSLQWNVSRTKKKEGKHKERGANDMAQELEAKLIAAARTWRLDKRAKRSEQEQACQSREQERQDSDDQEANPAKRPRTDAANAGPEQFRSLFGVQDSKALSQLQDIRGKSDEGKAQELIRWLTE